MLAEVWPTGEGLVAGKADLESIGRHGFELAGGLRRFSVSVEGAECSRLACGHPMDLRRRASAKRASRAGIIRASPERTTTSGTLSRCSLLVRRSR